MVKYSTNRVRCAILEDWHKQEKEVGWEEKSKWATNNVERVYPYM
jgi:hypothetical protein